MSQRVEVDPYLKGLDYHIKPLVPLFDGLQKRCSGQEHDLQLPNDVTPVKTTIFPIGPLRGDYLQDTVRLDALQMEAFCTDFHMPARTPEGARIYAGVSFVNANTPSTAGSLLVYRPRTPAQRQPAPKVFVSYRHICAADLDEMREVGAATDQMFGKVGAATHLDWLTALLRAEERKRNTNNALSVVPQLELFGVKHTSMEIFTEIIHATTHIMSRSLLSP